MRSGIFLIVLLIAPYLAAAQQGITGSVVVVEGNQMPGPGQKRPEAKPARRNVVVYALTNQQETTLRDGLFSDLKTERIAKTRSKRNGRFRISLPPGRYSIFVEEADGLYANVWDAEMNIHPVTVTAKTFSNVKIEITRNASF